MCGIAGFVDRKNVHDERLLGRMAQRMIHRGPDNTGYFTDESTDRIVGLTQTRLSIIDLSPGANQPMEINGKLIVYNGEVYNFIELRKELSGLGHSFSTESDTEVVLRGYIEWGRDVVYRLKGMFAFVILDGDDLFLCRDRYGVKPLYYSCVGDNFVFCSEVSGIKEYYNNEVTIDPLSVTQFITYGYILEPRSIYKEIAVFPAGSFGVFHLSSYDLEISSYWDSTSYLKRKDSAIAYSDAKNRVEVLLKRAMKNRSVSDVPIGIFLSGGYDSTLVTSLFKDMGLGPVRTYTVGFEDSEFNEANDAQRIASFIGSNHKTRVFRSDDVVDVFNDVINMMDEPLGDPSILPTHLVAKVASEDVKVVLSADGGDEVFAGYSKYSSIERKFRLFNRIPIWIRRLIQRIISSEYFRKFYHSGTSRFPYYKLERISRMLTLTRLEMLDVGARIFDKNEIDKIVNLNDSFDSVYFPSLGSNVKQSLSDIQAQDILTYLKSNILKKIDRATMWNSIEGREPLLDTDLFEYVALLNESFKIHGSNKKRILKDITHKFVPSALLDRPKKGFGIPLSNWLSNELSEIIVKLLNKEVLRKYSFLNASNIEDLATSYLDDPKSVNPMKIWNLLVLVSWLEVNYE